MNVVRPFGYAALVVASLAALKSTMPPAPAAPAPASALQGSAWESAAFGTGCRYDLALHQGGRYRLALSCLAPDATGRITEAAEGTYHLAGGRLELGPPAAATCPHSRLVSVWTCAPLDGELDPAGHLTLLRGTELLHSFHRVHLAAANDDTQPGCASAMVGIMVTSAD